MNDLGYKNSFSAAQTAMSTHDKEKIFANFRVSPGPYKFVLAEKTKKPDFEALNIAKNLDKNIYNQYLNIPKPLTGYSDEKNFCKMDHLDSRHLMMSTIIQKHLGNKFNNIVEIGGGFGNWFRLNENVWDFNSWNIIDLQFVLDLQKWYINHTCKKTDKINFYDYDHCNLQKFNNIDLTIASHSLSELDLVSFQKYSNSILNNTNYLFYATHLSAPSKELVDKKIKILENKFTVIAEVYHLKNKVKNVLFKNKL